jgi:hypothetical protein
MKFTLAMVCMFGCGTSALAQSGITNIRDGNGNIVRDTGVNQARGSNQGPINPIGQIRSGPVQTPPTNSNLTRGSK